MSDKHTEKPSDATREKASEKSRKHTTAAGSSYANYLFGNAGVSDTPAWSDSTQGRAAIRLISRGLVGTAFFWIGGRLARQQLHNYHPEKALDGAPPLQWLARGIDNTVGQVVKGAGYVMANTSKATTQAEKLLIRRTAALEAVEFRQKGYFHSEPGQTFSHIFKDGMKIDRAYNGRSYGAEVVGVTFDFAMASIGDALTRNIIQAIDPNIKHSWMRDKDGKATTRSKGRFDFNQWIKSVGTTSWRIMTKNQGEDWATGFIYVFQMKQQRQMLNKFFKGSKIVFDNGWLGGASKIDEAGRIVGDHQLAGAIDLHLRFVGYNWYTLMFREAYDAVGTHFENWKNGKESLIPHLPSNPISAAINGAGSSVRYIAKSFIKTNLYMNPAVIPFWLFRVPQSKWRGAFLAEHAEPHVNAIGLRHADPDMQFTRTDVHGNVDFDRNTAKYKYPPMQGKNLRDGTEPNALYVGQRRIENPEAIHLDLFSRKAYKHYRTDTLQQKIEKGFSQAINPFGWFSYQLGNAAMSLTSGIKPTSKLGRFIGWDTTASGSSYANPTALGREHFVRGFVDASVAYTPYMWAKAETALRVDEHAPNKLGEIDKAIYGAIDSAVAFNPRGVITHARDVIRLATHFDKNVKGREVAAAPVTTVDAQSIRNTGKAVQLRAANENEANDNEAQTRSWAENVAGRHLGANFQAPGSTRH